MEGPRESGGCGILVHRGQIVGQKRAIGLRHHVRRHVELAQRFVGWVEEDPEFEVAAPAPLNLVCFRHRGGDEMNQRILDRVNRSGELYLTHTRLHDRLTLRLCVGQTHTEAEHVEGAWRRLREAALG